MDYYNTSWHDGYFSGPNNAILLTVVCYYLSMIELIIFDWDDVFTLGSIRGYYKCTHEALAGVGVIFGQAEEEKLIKETWPLPHDQQLAAILKDYPERVAEAIKIYEANWFGDTFVDCLTIVPGSQQFLLDMSKKYKLAVASGAHPKVLRDRVFKKFNIPNIFEDVITIYDLDDPRHAKPHPFMANKIMQNAGVPPNKTVLVGDAESDMQMAWNAGIEPVAVLTGHLDRDEAAQLGVRHIIDNVLGLEAELCKFQ